MPHKSYRDLLIFLPIPLSRWFYIQSRESANGLVTLFVLIFAIAGWLCQVTHMWSHAQKRPGWVSWLWYLPQPLAALSEHPERCTGHTGTFHVHGARGGDTTTAPDCRNVVDSA